MSFQARRKEIIDALDKLPELIGEVLKQDERILAIAKELHEQKSLLIMGRGYNFATCLEGALKVKELTYMHCEGIQSGELKHGPLAMVDKTVPIPLIMMRDPVYSKCMNALQQIVARDGRPIIICETGDTETAAWAKGKVIEVPKTVDPMQSLSYHLAVLRGCNVDCPRNLAKSVTVEQTRAPSSHHLFLHEAGAPAAQSYLLYIQHFLPFPPLLLLFDHNETFILYIIIFFDH